MIPRSIEIQIKNLLSFFPILVLTGARQTGKTTLLTRAFPEWRYVSLDLPSMASLAEDSPEEFFTRYYPPCIIDEVQHAPGLFRHLKSRVDSNRSVPGNWILTGSQKFTLMQEISDSLAGRVAILELEGLAFAELNEVSEAQQAGLEGIIRRGGFPELWRLPRLPTAAYFSSYTATYLERDVRQILNVGSLRDFERFIRVLASSNAGVLDLSRTASAVGVTVKTAAAWLSVLEASNIVALLEPWHGNLGKRIVKRPKIYFKDTGLLSWLLGVPKSLDASGPFTGGLWETFVFAELRKTISASGMNRSLYYYRDNRGTEVDFLILGDGCRLVEAKWTEHPSASDCHGLKRLADSARESSAPEFFEAKAYILCRTKAPWTIHLPDLNVGVRSIPDLAEILGIP